LNTATLTMAGEIELARSIVLQQVAASGSFLFNNRITGTGDVFISSQGTGSVTLFRAQGPNASNDWVGNLIVNAGSRVILGGGAAGQINPDKSVPDTANIVFNTGSVLQLSPGTQLGYESVNALISNSPGDGVINQALGTSPTFRLTVGAGNGGGDFSGVISNSTGTLHLIKAGTGTQTLGGASTYSGATTVAGGTLLVNNTTGSGTGTGAVTVTAATSAGGPFGTLGGTGTIGGTVTVQAGAGANGVIAPGASTGVNIGTLAIGGDLALAGTYTADVQTGPNLSDLVAVTGSLNLTGGTLNLPLTNTYDAPASNTTYTLVTYGGPLTGTFAAVNNLPSGYFVSYGTPGQVNLTPVPEPVAVLLACGGAAATWAAWRRRRQTIRT
jgi:autotransporter-associated beta strand protein